MKDVALQPEISVEALVGQIADEFTERLQRGERPDIEAYAQRYPQIAALLREALPALQALGPLASDLASAPPVAAESLSGCLGDFRLLREVGRGGMGVVYEAEQLSLGRRVALKVLPFAGALDARQLQRFQNEAQAAAHLHHTNIVPVFAVGCERGMHFYAMQFIDGQTVATLIRECRQIARLDEPGAPGDEGAAGAGAGSTDARTTPVAALPTEGSTQSPTFFRTVARLGLQAAEALEYAHAEGIIHRDIKPANLLLEWRAGGVNPPVLWITDFGLARFRSEGGLTLTGDLLGTLRYMSPEQALGQRQRVDHRTDVYSLGATLYELLTLEPVHGGRDRQELLRQIGSESPRPPRRLNPAVPADLETIVLKALDKEPEGRYATAQELADDLRRFLEDKPIQARRPTLLQRARKWARRHQPIVAAAVAVLLIGVAAWAVSTVLILCQRDEARAQQTIAQEQRQRAEEQQALAQQQRELARQAVDEMYTEVAERWLADQPRLQDVQRRFLIKALQYYEAFAADPGAEPALRHQAGMAYRRVGEIERKLGQPARAETAYRHAIDLHAQLAADFPAAPAYRQELARDQERLGNLLLAVGRLAEAEPAYRRALGLREQLAAEFPNEPVHDWELATIQNHLGLLFKRTGRWQDAEQTYRQAIAGLDKLTADVRAPAEYRASLADVQKNLGTLLLFHTRLPEAEQALRRALALEEKLVAEFPANPELRRSREGTRNNLALVLSSTGRSAEAEVVLRQALTSLGRLAEEYPAVPEYGLELANLYQTLAEILERRGQLPEVEQALRRAVTLEQRLAAESPSLTLYRVRLAHSQRKLGNVLKETDHLPEAEQAYRQAVAIMEKLAAEIPRSAECADELIQSRRDLGYLLWDAGRTHEAGQAFEQALTHFEKLVAAHPGVAVFRRDLAWLLVDCPDHRLRDVKRAVGLAREAVDRAPQEWSCWDTLGVAQYRAEEYRAAIRSLRRTLEFNAGGNCVDWLYLAMAHAKLGEPEQARPWYDQACTAIARNKTVPKPLLTLRAEAGALLGVPPPGPP